MSSAGKVAVITGASSGIGADVARRLLKEGYSVALIARSVEKMRAVVRDAVGAVGEQRALVIGADLADMDATRRAADRVRTWVAEEQNHRLDVLVNNAGAGKPGSMEDAGAGGDSGEHNVAWHMQLNAISVFVLTTALRDVLVESQKRHENQPSVVNVGSIAGMCSFPKLTTYCMAKAALHSFTKCAALELAPHRVRVNAIAPATVVTNFVDSFGITKEQKDAFLDASQALHPIGRLGYVHDTTEAILFLADASRSGWITGEVMRMDGGRVLVVGSSYNQAQQAPAKSKL